MKVLNTIFYSAITDWSNLLLAWRKAAKGKRSAGGVSQFEYQLADELLSLQKQLLTHEYKPMDYTHFYIHEPKQRLISAAPFRDRVVHHALCNIIEPIFEHYFINDSYANRKGKGTHKAIDRLQHFSKKYRYVLRLDIVKHFQSIDHAIMFDILKKYIQDKEIRFLIYKIIKSGEGIEGMGDSHLFPNDDLLSLCRPKGLPIGNLTSQFWSNCYLHPLDCFIKRELRCKGYLRYVDDFSLFSNSKTELWEWKIQVKEKLAHYRLRFHENSAQVIPVKHGIPWLGFVVYPDYRRVKSRKVVYGTRRLKSSYQHWQQGKMSFAEFDARVQGWINHVSHADSWGLRGHVLNDFVLNKKSRDR